MGKILSKLYEIDDLKTIYNIHRCRAGWGIIFFYSEKQMGDDWKTGLSVDRYYHSFEDMINAEWLKLEKIENESIRETY